MPAAPTGGTHLSQKSGVIEGGLATEEFLESTDSWKDTNRAGGTKGAQQYYSPPELAALATKIIGTRLPVLDPTAGDGSLLRDFDSGYSYGIEIDTDQVNNAEASYRAIRGDFQHAYPLLRQACPEFNAIVANPPFGLKWSDPSIESGKEMSSTRLTFIYTMRLLSHDGQIVFVTSRDRFDREIAKLPEAKGIYAAVECEDLFDGVVLPCVIAFGVQPGFRSAGEHIERRKFTRDTLDLAAPWVTGHRQAALGYNHVSTYTYNGDKYADAWSAIQKEYDIRLKKRIQDKYERKYDLELHGKVLNVVLSPYAQIVLNKTGDLYTIRGLHRHNVNYFRINEAAWRHVTDALEESTITVEPRLVEVVEKMLEDNRHITTPLYPIKDVQRLGWLSEIDRIKCAVNDEARGFYAGEKYEIKTRDSEFHTRETRYEPSKKTGELIEKKYEQMRRRLEVSITSSKKYHKFYDDDEHVQDIQYLSDHFDIPDPGDLADRFPDAVHRMRCVLMEIENDTLIPNTGKTLEQCFTEAAERECEDLGIPVAKKGLQLKKFQREDIARILVKRGGLLAWEQGLGKTLAALIFTEACVRLGCQDAALFVVPQDLVPQWLREAKRFFDRDLEIIAPDSTEIDNPDFGKVKRARRKKTVKIPMQAIAHRVHRHVKSGGTGWFITYYEALSTIGTQRKNFKNGRQLLPVQVIKTVQVSGKFVPGKYVTGPDGGWKYEDGYQKPDTTKELTSVEICPKCHADTRSGWDGKNCVAIDRQTGKTCGYSHVATLLKPAASILSTTFKKGVVIVDELTMIKSKTSKRSLAIQGIRARHRLGMTGTPIKNYVHQLFYLLWWTLGNSSKRFPYAHEGGYLKFAKDFSVWEWDVTSGVKAGSRASADVTNLSMLWKLLASSIIRRRMEETGETIVNTRYHEHYVPLGVAQRKQMQKWLQNFWRFFEEKYPDAPVVKAGAHKMMAPMLGLMPKMEYAATLPLGDPEYDWLPEHQVGAEWINDVSDFTPSNLRTLELAIALAKTGRKVLVGSCTKETGRWLADRLCEKGVIAEHILDASGQTAAAPERAELVHAFQTSNTQVFCAGIQAIRLGHSLDAGSAIVINGLPWDWESFDQFVKRVRRLTSKRDIDVHLVIPQNDSTLTITEKKWNLLQQKGQAADLALDGRLVEKDVEKIKDEDVLRELMDKGIQASDDEIAESEIERTWDEFPTFEAYTPPPGITTGYTRKKRAWTNWEAFEYVIGDFTKTQLALPVKACETISHDEEILAALEEQLAEDDWERPTTEMLDAEAEPEHGIHAELLEEEEESVEVFPELDEEGVARLNAEAEDTKRFPVPGQLDITEVPDDTKSSHPSPTPISKTDTIKALRDLKELLDEGILTDIEFTEAKTALLTQLKEAA